MPDRYSALVSTRGDVDLIGMKSITGGGLVRTVICRVLLC